LRTRRAENLIKMHKVHSASDRTSCRSANCQPVAADPSHRRVLVIVAASQQGHPKEAALATRGVSRTLRLRLLKIAARVMKLYRSVRVALLPAMSRSGLSAPSQRHQAGSDIGRRAQMRRT